MSVTLDKRDITENGTAVESPENLDLEEEEVFFQDVDLLTDYNIAMEDISVLKKAGINTLKGIQMTTRKKLLEFQGFNPEKVEKIKDACCKVVASSAFMTALEVSDQRRQIFKLSTGSSKLE